jgi:hypothetical protein
MFYMSKVRVFWANEYYRQARKLCVRLEGPQLTGLCEFVCLQFEGSAGGDEREAPKVQERNQHSGLAVFQLKA